MGWTSHSGRSFYESSQNGAFHRGEDQPFDPRSGQSSIVVGTIEIGDCGRFPVRLTCSEEGDVINLANFQAISERLDAIACDAASIVEQLRADYGHHNEPISDTSSMDFSIPCEPIEDGATWTIWFHEDVAGWMIEMEGWKVVGSQGVF